MPTPPPGSRRAEPAGASTGAIVARVLAVVLLLGAVVGGGLWKDRQRGDDGSDRAAESGAPSAGDDGGRDARDGQGSDGGVADDPGEDAADLAREAENAATADTRVLVVSIDGLGSSAVGADTPTLQRLLDEGAGTLNARTAVEQTVTLPNHTSMVTGDRIDAGFGGHGVTWNDDVARTVPAGVSSVFTVIDEAGGSSEVLAAKSKFSLWERTWPGAVDETMVSPRPGVLVDEALSSLEREGRDLTFVHLGGPDFAGHRSGWGSVGYARAVRTADGALGDLVAAIEADPGLARDLVVVVTSDHGGIPGTPSHSDASAALNYTIPFVVWGAGVADGDLYELNPDYADPGTAQPSYDAAPPVRNGDVANLVAALLGLDPVPGSEIGVAQELSVR